MLYSTEIERYRIDVTEAEVRLRGLPASFDGVRVVQISDIHLDEFTEPFFLRQVVDKINSMKPDAILLTGDFVSDEPRSKAFANRAAWECAKILSELHCRQLYAVMGNHDVAVGAPSVTEALTASGILVLNNGCLPIERFGERTGGRIWLAGLDDPFEGLPDPDLAIPASIRNRPNEPVILMCHAPDYVDDLIATPAGRAVDLMLSGHTHGGQIRMPFVGPMSLPPMGRKYVEGWFRFGRMQLYVNRGIGTVELPIRFACPPEILHMTLRSA
ncbi:metallophosphoesterase [Acidicapsa acidisoli]|uniref:metallophosphoesterase n=1 Tax=Acidicapsa acidisoli TaxID=1615681 RepID=UPI0021DFF23F|nr:metallophosphoesterase [Acidicapsa acidisoli]